MDIEQDPEMCSKKSHKLFDAFINYKCERKKDIRSFDVLIGNTNKDKGSCKKMQKKKDKDKDKDDKKDGDKKEGEEKEGDGEEKKDDKKEKKK